MGETCLKCGNAKERCECRRVNYLFNGISAVYYNIGIAKEGVYGLKMANRPFAAKYFGERMAKSFSDKFDVKPDVVLVDAISKLDVDTEVRGIVKGDLLSYSIGCASILAKVTRDRMMCELAKEYPEYGFEKHKGYGTKLHIEAIRRYGPCVYHRLSFLKFLEK